jgi:hypothetical protein
MTPERVSIDFMGIPSVPEAHYLRPFSPTNRPGIPEFLFGVGHISFPGCQSSMIAQF